jgi:dGTPase
MLARLRFSAERSRGRRYPELPHPYRNDFQRDRDRVIHSRAFRRLENKTQVFPAGLSDHFRNRLTHSIEVAQIARTVASALALNEDLTEALALVHDIGHPPFAHAGEEELNRILTAYGERFDHNLHALRIVEQFESKYARFPGLNLTFEVREGIVKHSRDYAAGDVAEVDDYLPGLRPPLEAQLIDFCDEVAYNTADLDDAYSAGLLTSDSLRAAVPEFDALFEEADMHFPGAPERIRVHEIVRRLVDHLVSGLIQGTVERAQKSGADSPEDVRLVTERIAGFSPETRDTSAALKSVLRKLVYHSEMVVEERSRWTRKIAEVFDFLMRHPGSLPEAYREETADQPLHRTVCDYIAGMTDGFFVRTYDHLIACGRSPAG